MAYYNNYCNNVYISGALLHIVPCVVCIVVNVFFMRAQESQEAKASREEEKRALVKEHKKRERELTKQGKKPFYIKKCKYIQGHEIMHNHVLSVQSASSA